jgi:hypothetical protein
MRPISTSAAIKKQAYSGRGAAELDMAKNQALMNKMAKIGSYIYPLDCRFAKGDR